MYHVRWYLRVQSGVIFQHVQKLVSCLSSKDILYKQSWLYFKPKTFPFGLYIRQNNLFKELQRLHFVAVGLQISARRESIWKLNFWEALTRLFVVYQLRLENFIFHGYKKMAVMDLLSFIPEIETFFVPFFPLYLKKSGRISKVSDRS